MDRKLILLFLASVIVSVCVAVDWTSVERRIIRWELEWGLRSRTVVAGPKAGQGDSALVQQVKWQYLRDTRNAQQARYETDTRKYEEANYNKASQHLRSESDRRTANRVALQKAEEEKQAEQRASQARILETRGAANGVYSEGYKLGGQFRIGRSSAVNDSQLAKDALVMLNARYPQWNNLPKLRVAFISGFTDGYRNRKPDPGRR